VTQRALLRYKDKGFKQLLSQRLSDPCVSDAQRFTRFISFQDKLLKFKNEF
jgi:hypothetical protein